MILAICAIATFTMMIIMLWLFCNGIVAHMDAKWPHTCNIIGG